MDPTQVVGTLAFFAACLSGMACLVVVLVNMFRAVANRKEGVPLFPNWYESPFNILFRPSQLTDRGLSARRWCFYGVVGFFIFCASGIAIGVLTGVAH
jgi:hypothetical protein